MAQDTLKIITYNVLHYGDGCQGTDSYLHSNLNTIVQYSSPDVVGLVKVQAINLTPSDVYGISPAGYADSILKYGFNAAYSNRYALCPLVSFSHAPDGDMDLLFYDKNKLGFVTIINLCIYQEDFNLYKLYYKDPNLSVTHDSTFLYFILNHTVSGSVSASRDLQDTLVIKSLKKTFSHLPNVISMGDFNTRSSLEPGYQLFTATTDTSFIFRDPPYIPDNTLTYPSNWSSNSGPFSSYLNTSTRQTTLPNSCGTTGGAKGWYLHILVSPWIVKNYNYVKYVPNSYVTLGNDGNRLGISINGSTNTSVPPNVLTSLFQMSDKYPIMVKLAVNFNTSGISPADPMIIGIKEFNGIKESITINNPVDNNLVLHFPPSMLGQKVFMSWYDVSGRLLGKEEYTIDQTVVSGSNNLTPGMYIVNVLVNQSSFSFRVIKE
jgi:hypothetical protein